MTRGVAALRGSRHAATADLAVSTAEELLSAVERRITKQRGRAGAGGVVTRFRSPSVGGVANNWTRVTLRSRSIHLTPRAVARSWRPC